MAWHGTQQHQDLWLFSAGLKLADGRAGAGLALFRAGQLLEYGHAACSIHYEVYDVEAAALAFSLRAEQSGASRRAELWGLPE
jgi:hypothetical protein